MQLPPFVIDVAAGTLSGAIVTYLPLRNRRRDPANTSAVKVNGIGNRTHVDQSRHQAISLTQNTTAITVAPAQSRSAQSDSNEALILVGLAGLAAVLGFLFIWPVALGFLLGSCLIIAVAYVRATSGELFRSTGRRTPALVHSVLALTLTAATCGFAFFASADGHGLVNLERELSARFPGYSTSIPTRWNVLTHHASEVFSLLGWHAGLMLFSQVAGLVMCALITAVLGIRTIGAVSLRQQANGRRLGRIRQNLATRLMTEHPAIDLAVIGLGGAIALFLASGLAVHVATASRVPTHASTPARSVPAAR